MDFKIIVGFAVVAILFATIVGCATYTLGYRHALQDYLSGNIDCIIKVQHPDLLEKMK